MKDGEIMRFQLNIRLNDKDYLDYNIFWMLKSPYGKKEMLKTRIMIAFFCGAIALIFLFRGEFSSAALLGMIPCAVLCIVLELLWNTFFVWALKSHIKSIKGKGKMGYSPVAEMEFYDDRLIETTPENKTEQKYSAVERVSVIADKVIYIHVNNVMSYILPRECFASKEQYAEFLGFIRTKCSRIDMY